MYKLTITHNGNETADFYYGIGDAWRAAISITGADMYDRGYLGALADHGVTAVNLMVRGEHAGRFCVTVAKLDGA